MSDEIEKTEAPRVGSNVNDWFRYMPEKLDPDEDNGTMPENIDSLKEAVVGCKIVNVEEGQVEGRDSWQRGGNGLIITLDNGKRVEMMYTSDCCAYTQLEKFLLHPELVNHAITGVGTTEGFTKWHIYADYGDVLELDVSWSSGNPFYYGYGFDIAVRDIPTQPAIDIRTV